jgi:hypothetical protein
MPPKSKAKLTTPKVKTAKVTDKGTTTGAAVITADPLAAAAAEAAAEKRKPYVPDCQSCQDWANHYTNSLPCGHDKKK